ncbi:MAG: methylated-DNA--[protein]-cysteine S-methyltransferase [Planctomycetia bacterium]|nr:methylated-DNA--[protein]-cysteine S-methyltransferase [Planctomycetia bacterium]
MSNSHPFSRLSFHTPIGKISLVAECGVVTQLRFEGESGFDLESIILPTDKVVLESATRQLQEYFAQERKTFDLPIAPMGTDFMQRVWHALLDIPYGETRTYGEIAKKIGAGRAARAVGNACGKNLIPIFIPCHRVVGAHSLGGFSCGLDKKKSLLSLERCFE